MKQLLLGILLLQATAPHQRAGSGINLFTLREDMAIGVELAKEADRALPLVRDSAIETYLRSIGTTLAGSSPLPTLNYSFQIVNRPEANAETFPGGRIYIDRGLVDLTTNEHELAGLVAHEIAHAAARHGTRQLSAQLLVQSPASVLSGVSTRGGWKDQLARLGVSPGERSTFLRYSREQEIEANSIAVRILVKSEFSPYGLSSILRRINKPSGTGRNLLPAYAFNHPQVEDAAAELDAEITRQRAPQRPLKAGPGFVEFRETLAKLPAAPPRSNASRPPRPELANEHVHPEAYYHLRYPDGWQVKPTTANGAIIFAPGGVQPTAAGDDVRTGIMFDLFPVPDKQMTLEQSTNRLLVFLRQRNQELRPIAGAQSQMLIGAEPALRTVMIANSRPTQIVWVATRQYYDSLFYLVCVAPEDDFPGLQPVFEEILRSVELR